MSIAAAHALLTAPGGPQARQHRLHRPGPPEVVEENRDRLAAAEQAKARLEGILARLESVG